MVRKTYFFVVKSRIHCMHSFTYTMARNKNVELVKLLRTASCYLSHPGAKKISGNTKRLCNCKVLRAESQGCILALQELCGLLLLLESIYSDKNCA